MIVLDTNVLSGLMLKRPDPTVVHWLDNLPNQSIWTTSISVFEIQYGLKSLQASKNRTRLQAAFDACLAEELQDRVLDFDVSAAEEASAISAERRRIGRPVEVRDVMIAGIVVARSAQLATRNTAHFDVGNVSLIDPWSSVTS